MRGIGKIAETIIEGFVVSRITTHAGDGMERGNDNSTGNKAGERRSGGAALALPGRTRDPRTDCDYGGRAMMLSRPVRLHDIANGYGRYRLRARGVSCPTPQAYGR